MKYIIYKLEYPEHIRSRSFEGYYPKEIRRAVLEKLDVSGVYEEHDTFEFAVAEIVKNALLLKGEELIILPVIHVRYDGTI